MALFTDTNLGSKLGSTRPGTGRHIPIDGRVKRHGMRFNWSGSAPTLNESKKWEL